MACDRTRHAGDSDAMMDSLPIHSDIQHGRAQDPHGWSFQLIGLSRCNNYMPVGNLPCRKRENDQFLAAIGWIAATLIKLLLWLYWICIANIDHT